MCGLAGLVAMLGCRPGPSEVPDGAVWGGGARRQKPIVMERAEPPAGEPAAVMDVLERELDANLTRLQADELEEPAYYLGYDLVEVHDLWLEAQNGALLRDDRDADRTIDVDVRVGERQLDNSHTQGGNFGPGNGLGSALPVSMEDVELSLAQALWLDTEQQYRDAVQALRSIRNEQQMRSEGEQRHPDFSQEKVLVHTEPRAELDLDELRARWTPVVQRLSQVLGADSVALDSRVVFLVEVRNRHFINSEGSRVQSGQTRLRVAMDIMTKAEDGMELVRSEQFDAHVPAQLPRPDELEAAAKRLREELAALRDAPLAEPYTGPAVLEGRAAGVFFHEIFGHRLEGHRQKDDLEGQTFTRMLDKKVLPSFLDVVDDPTVSSLGSVPLNGHYFVDDEAVEARRVVLVDRGKLKGFLLSRSPVLPFKRSNGHGRRERGYQSIARQGNLIVSSRKTLSRKDLRAALRDEIRRQNKPYGLWFADIEGGYTTTDRSGPQAFKVLPRLVYKVYADGKPDELLRGADIVGTPLAAFETILATGDQPGIFNGMCGAESGWVPVSAVSPSLLLRGLEIERAAHDRDRPPLLPPPGSHVRRRR